MKKVDLPQPTLLLAPFCSEGNKNSIPYENTDSSNPQKADLKNGFPTKTQGSPDDGKLPPERADFNGLGNLTTSYDFFYQAGGTFTFSPTISTAIGGYPKDARLWYKNDNDVSMILRSTIDDNTDNFNTDPSCIGTTWVIDSIAGVDNSSITFLDCKFSDKIINNMSWVLSDGGWKAGSTYTNIIAHLKEDIAFFPTNTPSIVVSNTSDYTAGTYVRDSSKDEVDGTITYYAWNYNDGNDDHTFYLTVDIDSMTGTEAFSAIQGQRIYKNDSGFVLTKHKVVKIESESVDNNGTTLTLNVWVGSDGHRIVDVTGGTDQETAVSAIYAQTGVAWYYILDVANTRFKLPQTKWNFVGVRSSVGKFVSESLPDHKHKLLANENITNLDWSGEKQIAKSTNGGLGNQDATLSASVLDATLANSSFVNDEIYQSGVPVQQRATEMYLYFYVGGFNETAIEETAGISATTINNKMDIDMGNMDAGSFAKNTITTWSKPDYSSGVSIASSNYSAPDNGFICFAGCVAPMYASFTASINGENIAQADHTSTWIEKVNGSYSVSTGDVLTYQNLAGGTITFYPVKGL